MSQENKATPLTDPLLWLASLEKNCPGCVGCRRDHDGDPRGTCACATCHGTGKVPVLDLLEPCPLVADSMVHEEWCLCRGRGGLPKQGRDALHEAMVKDGWGYYIHKIADGPRFIRFYKAAADYHHSQIMDSGIDSDDWLAAVKAMMAVGYSI